jgi:hypothetical protein
MKVAWWVLVNAELLEAAYEKLPVKEIPKSASEHPISLAG